MIWVYSIAGAVALIAAIASYYAIGWKIYAQPAITSKIQERCEEWPSLVKTELGRWRKEETENALFALNVWPLAWLARHTIDRAAASAPLAPAELQQQVQQRDARIAELERELRIR